MIADLHCHFPMHLLSRDRHPHGTSESWLQHIRDDIEADLEDVLAHLINNPDWGAGWRVDLDGLERGGARIVCSVLYWPPAEFDVDEAYGADPEPGYFDRLENQLDGVERALREQDPDGARHVIARRAADLDDESRVVFVHCVEGGFHLGPDDDGAIEDHVRRLADQGVAYITLAHLFFRGVAANAPAIPLLSDRQYDHWFHQDPGVGLTSLGEAAVRAMYRHRVLIDISHMRQDAIDATFALLERLDDESGDDPREHPVIATHVGMRDANPDTQAYNLTADTVQRIRGRGGVAGVIMAQHQLGETKDEAASRAVLRAHIDAIVAASGGSFDVAAIGTDLDGFIKPTLAGIQRAPDLAVLEGWIREEYPADAADAILHGNARRVLRKALDR